jgi:transposase
MMHNNQAFVAFDVAKLRNAVAIADSGRDGDVHYHGEIDNTEASTRRFMTKLASKYTRLTFCYEAGPTGFGPYRLIKSLDHDCIVVAPFEAREIADLRQKQNYSNGVHATHRLERFDDRRR